MAEDTVLGPFTDCSFALQFASKMDSISILGEALSIFLIN
jgi:hypothetical protein